MNYRDFEILLEKEFSSFEIEALYDYFEGTGFPDIAISDLGYYVTSYDDLDEIVDNYLDRSLMDFKLEYSDLKDIEIDGWSPVDFERWLTDRLYNELSDKGYTLIDAVYSYLILE